MGLVNSRLNIVFLDNQPEINIWMLWHSNYLILFIFSGLETEDVGDPILETVTGVEGPILGPHHAEGDPIPGLSNFIPNTPHDVWSGGRFGATNAASL